MQITHVIRGVDHQPNTPFHIALYNALDAEPPAYAHVPLILADCAPPQWRSAVPIRGG